MRPRTLTGGVVLAAALALALSGCSDGVHPSVTSSPSAVSTGSTAAQAPPPVSYVRSTVFANLTVRHPAAWRLVPVERRGAGPSGVVGYLTDQTTGGQCSTSGIPTGNTTIACGPPVTSVGPDGVYLAFTGDVLVWGPPAAHNRVLDGHEATVRPVTPDAGGCPAGTADALQMEVFLPLPDSTPSGSGQTVTMTACYAGPDSGRIRQELDALIDSVQFT